MTERREEEKEESESDEEEKRGEQADQAKFGGSTTSHVIKNKRLIPEFTPVIMAAGYGSQMYEVTNMQPKCMLPVANTPLIWYPIQFLIRHNFKETYVVVRRSAREVVEKYLTVQLEREAVRMSVEYVVVEDDSEMGTADSLRLIAPKTKSNLLVISGDLITRVSLSELANVHRANDAALTALVAPWYTPPSPDGRKKRNKKDDRDFMGLDPSDNRILFLSNEKDLEDEITFRKGQLSVFPHMRVYTTLRDCHLYIVSRTAVQTLLNKTDIAMLRCEFLPLLVRKQIKQIANSEQFTDLYSILPNDEESSGEQFAALCRPEEVGCYVHITDEFTVRVNQLHNYIKYNRAVAELMPDMMPAYTPPKTVTSFEDGVFGVHQQTQICKQSRVSEEVVIDAKCSIKRSYIGDGVKIGPHTKIADCVIMSGVTIESNVTLANCVICLGAVIRSKSSLKDCRVCDGFEVRGGSEYTDETLIGDEDNMMSFNIDNSHNSSSGDENVMR